MQLEWTGLALLRWVAVLSGPCTNYTSCSGLQHSVDAICLADVMQYGTIADTLDTSISFSGLYISPRLCVQNRFIKTQLTVSHQAPCFARSEHVETR